MLNSSAQPMRIRFNLTPGSSVEDFLFLPSSSSSSLLHAVETIPAAVTDDHSGCCFPQCCCKCGSDQLLVGKVKHAGFVGKREGC